MNTARSQHKLAIKIHKYLPPQPQDATQALYIALKVSPLSVCSNQNKGNRHPIQAVPLSIRKEKAASATEAHTDSKAWGQGPEKERARRSASRSRPFLYHSQSLVSSPWTMWMSFSIRHLRSTRAVKADMPACLMEPRPGGHHLFC